MMVLAIRAMIMITITKIANRLNNRTRLYNTGIYCRKLILLVTIDITAIITAKLTATTVVFIV